MASISPEQKKGKVTKPPQTSIKDDPSLMGTFISVMLLGGILVLSWASVFYLFISRN